MENVGRPAYKEKNFVETLFFVYSIKYEYEAMPQTDI